MPDLPSNSAPRDFADSSGPRAAQKIGWIGTGVMGTSMARHLLEAGHELHVHTRTAAKARPLIDGGATLHDTPADVVANSEVVFSIVGFPNDVRQIYLDGQTGLFVDGGSLAGKVFVDMTTSSPSLAVEIAEAAVARGAASLDAPVSGGDVGARGGTLSIMVGGPQEAFERVRPLLDRLGKTITHQGPAGSGQHTKMVNQTLIASGMIAICEALLYAEAAGLDPVSVLRSVSSGAAGSWSLSNLAPRILDGDFEPGFYVEHFLKDMRIALEEAERMQLCLPGLALAKQLYQSVAAQGDGRKGTQALYRTLKQLQPRGG